jgi:hypothetical protein
VSYSEAVALQLAATAPTCVHTLTLIEPPPVHTPSAAEFLAANAELAVDYRSHGSALALDRFMARVVGPDWGTDIEQHLPGGAEQVVQDADTFFATDMPALMALRFGGGRAEDRQARPVRRGECQRAVVRGGSAAHPELAAAG